MMEDKKAKTSDIQNDKEILNGILAQINSFDSKAGILISVIGIVFGLSLTLLSNFKEYKDCLAKTYRIRNSLSSFRHILVNCHRFFGFSNSSKRKQRKEK